MAAARKIKRKAHWRGELDKIKHAVREVDGVHQDKAVCGATPRENWTEPELRWTLESAFRRLDWPREAALLRGLAPWLVERLAHARKPTSWGNFRLNLEPDGGYLHLRQAPPPSRA